MAERPRTYQRATALVMFAGVVGCVITALVVGRWEWAVTGVLTVPAAVAVTAADLGTAKAQPWLAAAGVGFVAAIDVALWTGDWRWIGASVAWGLACAFASVIVEHGR